MFHDYYVERGERLPQKAGEASFEGLPSSPPPLNTSPVQQELDFYATLPNCDCPGRIVRGRTLYCSHGSGTPVTAATATRCSHTTCRFVCLTCDARHCASCFATYHDNPELELCLYLPLAELRWMQRVYLMVIKLDSSETVRCSVLAEAGARSGTELGRAIQRLMVKEMSQFGRSHSVSLSDLALLRAYDRRRGRLTADSESERTIAQFHRLGCCGRCVFDAEIACRTARQRSRFPLCRSTIAGVEATHGSSLAYYFRSFRWFAFLNFLLALLLMIFLALPALASSPAAVPARSLLAAVGAEDTVLFFGGYLPEYGFGWRMDTAWVLVLSGAMIFSLLFLVCSFDPDTIAQTGDRSVTAEHPFTSVLGSIGYRERDPVVIVQDTQALLTRLDLLGMTRLWLSQPRVDDRNRRCCTSPCDPWYVWFLISIAVIGGTCTLIVYAADWLNPLNDDDGIGRYSDRVNSTLWYYAPLLFPLGVTFLKFATAPIVRFCVKYEFPMLLYRPERARKALFWRLFLHRIAIASVTMYIFLSWATPATVPAATDPLAAAAGTPGCVCPAGADCSDLTAWECSCTPTAVGMRFWRLVVADIIWSLVLAALWSPTKYCCRATALRCGCGCCVEGASHAMFNREVEYPLRSSIMQRMHLVRSKNEFDPVENMLDLVYRQAFVWAAMAFAPITPLLAFVGSIVLFVAKAIEVSLCGRRSWAAGQLPAATEEVYLLSALLASAVLAFVPISFFLASSPSCGPFWWARAQDMSVWEAWYQLTNGLPEWLRVVFDYFTNTTILWMVVLAALGYVLTVSRQVTVALDRHDYLRIQIQLEGRERLRKQREIEFAAIVRGEG